jgi:hypothetical protein
MKTNKIKSLVALAMMGTCSQLTAAEVTANISFTTLPEITVSQVRAISFGQVLSLTANAICTMGVDGGGGTEALTNAQAGYDAVTATDMQDAGDLTGACDTNANGTVGIYEISSFRGADVAITLEKGTATEIDFTPAGKVYDYDATALEDLAAVGSSYQVQASSATTAFILEGKNRVFLGGTIQNTQALEADGTYTTDFEINVVYN